MSFRDFVAVLQAPPLRALAEHWHAVRGDRRMPGWGDIDALRLGPYLANIWAWKYDAATDSFTGRLAGEAINAIFGKSLRGAAMRDFFSPAAYALVFPRHRRVVTEPCLAHGNGPVFLHVGRRGHGERIILPLAEDGSHGDGIVGITVYDLPAGPSDFGKALAAEQITYFPLD